MHQPTGRSRPTPRQWQLSLAENPNSRTYTAVLRWRTFPCRWDHWDGSRTATILSIGPPISSAEDMESVLSLFVGADWVEVSEVHRRSPQAPT